MSTICEIDGALNFRDLGDRMTTHGQHVRSGQLYRSGTLQELSRNGIASLLDLDISLVIDLRSPAERQHGLTPQSVTTKIPHWRLDDSSSIGNPTPLLAAALNNPGSAENLMIAAFRAIPRQHISGYGTLFRAIANGRLPLLFHCMAGKDRTGVAAAVILDILGVSRDEIVKDFSESALSIEKTKLLFLQLPIHAPALSAPEEDWLPILKSNPSYLYAAFEQIDGEFGGSEGYLVKGLGLTEKDLDRTRNNLLD